MKFFFLLLWLFVSSHIFGQDIQSITTLPVNPTENDSVYILAHCAFNSAPCNQHTSDYYVGGNGFNAWALNCVGPLTVICFYTDTFSIGMLPAGNYVFNFHLDEGFGEVTCTPGIVAGPDSSYSFTVSSSSSTEENKSLKNAFSVYPNPVSDFLKIRFNRKIEEDEFIISLFNIYGTKLLEENTSSYKNEILIDLKNCKAGIYFLQLTANDSNSFVKIIKQ